MGRVYPAIDETLAEFIRQQQMFFVATAPLSGEGHVNLSPKGLDSLRILDEHSVAYLDLVGSGIETLSHVRENGRIVLMFCSFDGAPKILRLHGRGEAFEPGDKAFDSLAAHFPKHSGIRSIVRIHCERISDSCGYGVPRYAFVEHRPQLTAWADKKGLSGLAEYQRENNARSLDGLPGIVGKCL